MTRAARRLEAEAQRPALRRTDPGLAAWERRFGVAAGITGREADFQLDDAGLAPSATATRWRGLLDSLPGFESVVVGRQIHGTALAVHGRLPAGCHVVPGIDGHVTGTPGLLLAVTVADCIPVYLVHPESRTVGLVHAGWRGAAAGLLGVAVERLCGAASAPRGDIVSHCGVGICGACYEVGPEVAEALYGRRPPGRSHADLRALLAGQARAAGLREVSVSSWCSAHDADRFFSHRRSGGADGRMVAYLGVPLA